MSRKKNLNLIISMEQFTLAELGLFVGTIGGVLVSLIFAVQKSRCETIDCCGIKCKRKIIKGKEDPASPAP